MWASKQERTKREEGKRKKRRQKGKGKVEEGGKKEEGREAGWGEDLDLQSQLKFTCVTCCLEKRRRASVLVLSVGGGGPTCVCMEQEVTRRPHLCDVADE